VLDATNPSHPSWFDATARYEMLVFRGLAQAPGALLAQGAIRIRTRPTVFFVLPGMLVTLRAADSRIFAAHRARLEAPAHEGRHRMPARPELLMARLLNDMVDRYLDLRQPLADQLERLQRELLDPRRPFRDWPRLLQARTELRRLESLCEEQLDALQEWRDERMERHGAHDDAEAEALRVRIDDVAEHVHRVIGHVRRLEGSVESAVQLHFSAMSLRTSEIMRVLTVITAVFMPLTLVTGIFGMNFDAIPGLHSGNGFWLTLAGMGAIALALLLWFRGRRYIDDDEMPAARLRRREARPDGADAAHEAGQRGTRTVGPRVSRRG
jgi:Mg2+ and Co2+ transporter CorA